MTRGLDLNVDIEQIVQAVLRELQGQLAVSESLAGKTKNIAAKDAVQQADLGRTLELTDKLVTLATLENRLSGIDRLTLRPSAVVTPAAADLARARGVKIVRSTATAAPQVIRGTLALGIADCDGAENLDAPALIAVIGKSGFAVERIANTGLAIVTAELMDHVAKNGRPAVLLTSRPATAVCLANRCSGVRAVGGKHAGHLREAIDEAGANLLVVDPTSMSAFELRRLATEFCDRWPHPLPKEIQ